MNKEHETDEDEPTDNKEAVTVAPRPTHWEIFKGWFREAAFWREMTTRTLSALAAAFLIWGVGIASGALAAPGGAEAFGAVLEFLIIIGGGITFGIEMKLALSDNPDTIAAREEIYRAPRWLVFLGALGTLFGTVLVAFDFMSRITGGGGFIF